MPTEVDLQLLKDLKKSGLILALDTTDLKRSQEIARLASPYLDAIKVGLPLILSTPRNLIQKLKLSTGLTVIADLKISDVPFIAGKIARKSFDLGADALTVQGFAGAETIETCVREAGGVKDVIVITYMTHPDADTFMAPVAEKIVELARDCKATGIQAPGNRLEIVKDFRRIIGNSLVMMCCGVGVQGGEIGGPIRAGADFEIVGRTIYDSHLPAEEAKKTANTIGKYYYKK